MMNGAMNMTDSSELESEEIFGGFSILDMKELHSALVMSHISKAMSGERMKTSEKNEDLYFIRQKLVSAAWFVEAATEHVKKDMEIKARLCRESNRLHDELQAAKARIAELEARTVKLPEHFYPDGDIDCPLALNECEVIAALESAGVKVIKLETE